MNRSAEKSWPPDIKKIEVDDELYPGKFKMFVKDKKPIYFAGDIALADEMAIGIVGSRRCTKYGLAVAKEVATRAANAGVTVVSGLARGIDSAAHRAAIKAGGKTIGVLGGGVDVIYPPENRDLYEKIAMDGLLVSEYYPGGPAKRENFPVRNRLISALSEAVIVVEAAARSGSLITAECAVEQGKEVFAVPGNISSVYSMGTNKLIRDGAKALVIIDDIFAAIGKKGLPSKNAPNLGDDEKLVYEMISGSGEIPITDLYQNVQNIESERGIYPPLGIPEINAIITILEMKGLIYLEMGKVMIANFT